MDYRQFGKAPYGVCKLLKIQKPCFALAGYWDGADVLYDEGMTAILVF
ncbi:MAG: hypothetical protein ACLT64_07700 [Streptococcus salivarius]